MEKIHGKILVIDDDPDVLLSAKMVLKRSFEEVKTTNLPEQLIRRLSKAHYDVVLMDMNFSTGATSGQEGFDLLGRILETSPTTRVVMMTAYGEIETAVEAMKRGATDFIVKPWENAKLVQAVKTALQTPTPTLPPTSQVTPQAYGTSKSKYPPLCGHDWGILGPQESLQYH